MQEDQIDTVFSALASQTRRSMIDSLALMPSTPTRLAKQQDISLPAVHKQLGLLEAADLVRRQKVGRVNFVALNPDSLQSVKIWVNRYQSHWGSRNVSLDNYIFSQNSKSRANNADKGY